MELEVLHKLTPQMCEAFGLDRKIESYKWTRPITLYAWDLDCLGDVLQATLFNPAAEGITNEKELEALRTLESRLKEPRQNEGDAR